MTEQEERKTLICGMRFRSIPFQIGVCHIQESDTQHDVRAKCGATFRRELGVFQEDGTPNCEQCIEAQAQSPLIEHFIKTTPPVAITTVNLLNELRQSPRIVYMKDESSDCNRRMRRIVLRCDGDKITVHYEDSDGRMDCMNQIIWQSQTATSHVFKQIILDLLTNICCQTALNRILVGIE